MSQLEPHQTTEVQTFQEPLTIQQAVAKAIVNISESPSKIIASGFALAPTVAVTLGFIFPDTALRYLDAAKWAFLQIVMGR